MKLMKDVTEAIGKTPMFHLSRITKAFGVEGNIYAKLEYLNPGFSKKDRVALQMIIEAEDAGLLVPGQTVVELTSGNTGTGLAILCACKGYHFIACMAKGNSVERARMMKALGAEVILVDQMPDSIKGQVSGDDLALVEERTKQIVEERNAFRADQFSLKSCNHAHEYYTGEEMWEQMGGNVDVFVDFLGSGSTFSGCAKTLKKHNSSIRCYVADQAEYWAIVGLLHDIDYGLFPEEYCVKAAELLRDVIICEEMIYPICSHGHNICVDIEPKHLMEKVLYASDELTGLIGVAVRMRPSQSAMDLELSSVMKKFKDKRFAAGCSRVIIENGASMFDWSINVLLENTIVAMWSCEESVKDTMKTLKLF